VDQLNRYVNQEPLRNVILTTGSENARTTE
jgi:hypothetical protein